MSRGQAKRYILLYVPWLLALLVQDIPVISYFIAWLGSFYIFYLTLTGKIKPLPNDREFAQQLMRPVIIVQIIFAGYMCTTSIFYFLSLLGYEYLTKVNTLWTIDQEAIVVTAQCQRYYCMGHAAFVTGMLLFMNYPVRKKYHVNNAAIADLLMVIALIAFPVSLFFLKIPGLSQFYFQLSSLSFISGTLALAFAIPQRKIPNTMICLALYLFNFGQALTSGYKEPIIISTLVLAIFLYPNYKKIVTILFVPGIVALFLLLPSYVNSFRQTAWSDEEDADTAREIALEAALNNDNQQDTNWSFFVDRFSEIGMFTSFVTSTPERIEFYGFDLLKQSAIVIVPRAFWPSKPITEDLVMERVYNAGVINRNSNVSAKPAFIVDAYLSFGQLGIFVFLFMYGAIAQSISCKAEYLFGGYILGTALVFSGLFQSMWRGLSLEFLVNSVFWSYVTMWLFFFILRLKNIVKIIR